MKSLQTVLVVALVSTLMIGTISLLGGSNPTLKGSSKSIHNFDLQDQLKQTQDLPVFQQQGKYEIVENTVEGRKQTIRLNYTVPGEFYLKEKSKVVEEVDMVLHRESNTEMNVRITDKAGDLFNLPHEFPFPHTKDQDTQGEDVYGYQAMEQGTQLRVFQKINQKEVNVFNTKDTKFIFTKLYSEFTTFLDTPYVWGLGDRRNMNYLLESGTYTIWNRDQSAIDEGKPGQQVYGTHPMWLYRDTEANYHIVVLRTSNPMQVEYVKGSHLKFMVVGGILELKFIFGGSDPRTVIDKYHRYVNGWTLHPFWSSGWHQSRWGYKSSKELREVVANYSANDLPLDIMWSDLDYMNNRKDFTLDPNNYLADDFIQMTNKSDPLGVEWVPIVDPGIAVDSDCARKGIQNQIFIQSTKQTQGLANGTNSLTGWVWPGPTYYPDFNHPNATDTWHSCFEDFLNQYGFSPSGIWIDMNELSNFVDGEADPVKTEMTRLTNTQTKEIDIADLPFNPQGQDSLENRAVSISATHYNGDDAVYVHQQNGEVTELNFHSLNGFLEGIATKESQRRFHKTNLTFVLSRSTFMGSGRFTQHWLGDNASTWEWLMSSISHIFSFNLYGTPLIGDDVCGFNGNTNDQLCARWIQLGAFYPFARSHDSIDARPQEPWTFKPYVVETTRKSLRLRYSLLKYYYTQFVAKFDSSIGAGVGTIFNPLFYLYNDEQALTVDRQFMIGDALSVVPVVKEQTDASLDYTDQEYYVPAGATWFELNSGQVVTGPSRQTARIGFSDTALVYINQGHIVPVSDSSNVQRLRYLPSSLQLSIALIAEGDNYSAEGTYLSIKSYDEWNVEARCWSVGVSCLRRVVATGNSDGKTLRLTFTNTAESNDNSEPIVITQLNLYGLQINGQPQPVKQVQVELSSFTTLWRVDIPL